jgi:hypothetical protein
VSAGASGSAAGLFITVHPGASGGGQAAPLPAEGMLRGCRADLSRRPHADIRADWLSAWAVRAYAALGMV